ncbi:hypothetical protein TcCL_Unassigned05067 [Trypanosoma cruzi]|nr:hypothetical protein TcCL_Unassigned05067 [Trypanosoma cruzi]
MDEQCTGNTQRLTPAAAGVTAGVSLFTRQHTPSDTHTQNNRQNAKGYNRPLQSPRAAASRLIRVPPSHTLRHWRTSPRTAGGSPVDVSKAAVMRRQLQLLSKNPSAHVPGTQNATPPTGRTLPTSHPQHIGNIQITGSRPPFSRDAAGARIMCVCVCQWIYFQSSCAAQESQKKATAERGR